MGFLNISMAGAGIARAQPRRLAVGENAYECLVIVVAGNSAAGGVQALAVLVASLIDLLLQTRVEVRRGAAVAHVILVVELDLGNQQSRRKAGFRSDLLVAHL